VAWKECCTERYVEKRCAFLESSYGFLCAEGGLNRLLSFWYVLCYSEYTEY
jgi:hypothetical protein